MTEVVRQRPCVMPIVGELVSGRMSIEAKAALENCRALINQIDAGLSVEEPFVDVLSSTELLLYLDFAASALKKAAPLSREHEQTKVEPNYH